MSERKKDTGFSYDGNGKIFFDKGEFFFKKNLLVDVVCFVWWSDVMVSFFFSSSQSKKRIHYYGTNFGKGICGKKRRREGNQDFFSLFENTKNRSVHFCFLLSFLLFQCLFILAKLGNLSSERKGKKKILIPGSSRNIFINKNWLK